jgi:hypothetical protein
MLQHSEGEVSGPVLTVEKCDCPEGYTGKYSKKGQCCGLVTFWSGSGSADPRIRILLFTSVADQVTKNQGFSYFFLLVDEGSGSVQILTDPYLGGQKSSRSTTLKKA